jgi:NitT/TauT family transport system substrate-binding protein
MCCIFLPSKNTVKLTIAENFRGLFYVPYYALRELSLEQEHGVDIEWLPPGSPGGAIHDVKSGKIDLTWGGPMRVMIDHDTSADDERRLLSLSEAVGRDPFCLLSNQPNLSLTDLPNLRLSIVKEVPTPWLCLQADLADRGLSIPKQLATNWSMQEQLDALARNEVDVIQAFEPFVSQTLRGGGHLLYEASERGPTVYTGFITSRATLKARQRELAALDTALATTLRWMHDAGPDETARLVNGYFSELSQAQLANAARRYLAGSVWSHNTSINRAGFERLSESFFRGGAIRAPANYESCVFNFGDH